ncbi:MAG TPA: polysaccharide deacetylase family protein [Chitinophagaceae bacterium]|nr:polysaccharide deacetylase family protein [Chitinophagaceae bacterium]
MKIKWLLAIPVLLFLSCNPSPEIKNKTNSLNKKTTDSAKQKTVADVATILAKKEVPVLCYHHIRSMYTGGRMHEYEVSPAAFAYQMKALADSGYKTILPEDLYEYLVHGAALPLKPVMITFDDTDKEQFTIGAAEMNKFGFKGVYFIMTIAINRKRYMNEEELKLLSDSGHAIEAHTWDHHIVTKYEPADWDIQLVQPQKRLEAIIGRPLKYFAYPFGLWNNDAILELKKHGIKMAFILSTKRDSTEPLYTIRRMIVPGQWTAQGMIKTMKTTFHLK